MMRIRKGDAMIATFLLCLVGWGIIAGSGIPIPEGLTIEWLVMYAILAGIFVGVGWEDDA